MSERTNMELAPAPEEQLSFGDHTNIVKGKRTKRVRPQSPIPFSITANSSTGGVDEEKEEHCYNGDINNNNNNSSSTTSSVGLQDSTDEEEDMANCLILLAQGPSRESPKQKQQQAEEGMNYTKYSSRKFLEAATLGSSRAGYYVYECKTCNRTFPSFQALGGHRASHKKPKALMAMGHQDKKHHLLSSDEEEFQLKTNNKSSFSLQFNAKGNLYSHNHNNKKSKVHECSICGAEFTSGQALGGHMRRHRAPVGTATATATAPVPTVTATTLSFTPLALEPEEDHPRKKRHVLNLDLDLNLPAPEDDPRESKFAFVSKQQQQQHGQKQQQQQQTSLVFPAPALVNCHY